MRIPLNNGQSQSLRFVLENMQILRLVVKGLQFIDLLVAGKTLRVWNTNSKRVPGAEERCQCCFPRPRTKLPSSAPFVVRHNKPADDTRNRHLKWWWWGGGLAVVGGNQRPLLLRAGGTPILALLLRYHLSGLC